MSRTSALDEKILSAVPYIILFISAFTWFVCYQVGLFTFNKTNAVSVLSSVIQGMSALISVAIAVAIFRIQSLENRNQSLEQSTLNYIFQITVITYPQWIPSVEEAISSKSITDRYYKHRVDYLNQETGFNGLGREKKVKEYAEDRDIQQKRLEETLNLHVRVEETIQRLKYGVLMSVVFLMLPVILSFLMLMVVDALNPLVNFALISAIVLFSVSGIALLIQLVAVSTVRSAKS